MFIESRVNKVVELNAILCCMVGKRVLMQEKSLINDKCVTTEGDKR